MIQSNINQGLSIAGLLYSNTPQFEAAAARSGEKRAFERDKTKWEAGVSAFGNTINEKTAGMDVAKIVGNKEMYDSLSQELSDVVEAIGPKLNRGAEELLEREFAIDPSRAIRGVPVMAEANRNLESAMKTIHERKTPSEVAEQKAGNALQEAQNILRSRRAHNVEAMRHLADSVSKEVEASR